MAASSSLVARTLYILANDKKDINTTALNSLNVNGPLVEELIGYLLTCNLGLSCDLLMRYISPSTICPNHYVGVVLGKPSSTSYLGYANDASRFLWNFLAEKTSIPSKSADTSCPKNCSNAGESCVLMWRLMEREFVLFLQPGLSCDLLKRYFFHHPPYVRITTLVLFWGNPSSTSARYVQAYSTRLEFESGWCSVMD